MIVGIGSSVDFWCDNWSGGGPLVLRNSARLEVFPKLSQLYVDGQWELGDTQHVLDTELL